MGATKGSRNTICMDTNRATGDWASQAIVMLTSGTTALLQYKYYVFGDLALIYYAFLICVVFAFSCAFSAIFLLNTKPKAARVLKISAIMYFSLALTLLLSAIFQNYYVN